MKNRQCNFLRFAICFCAIAEAVALAAPKAEPIPSTQPKPTTMQSSATVGNELDPRLKPAIEALSAEMTQALKNPDRVAVRTECDYFTNRTETVPPDALLDAITRRLDRDPRIDAYVRWQLLSIQKTPFAGQAADRALQLYLHSTLPPAKPGASAIDQRRLSAQIGQLKPSDVEAFNARWDQTLRLNDLQFASFWGYRDALYARIPKTFDLLKTALVDADQRVQGGYDPKPFLKQVYADIRAWAASAPKADVGRMSDLVQSYATRDPTHRFTEVAYSDKRKSATWHTASTRFDKKTCETLAADLRRIASAAF